MQIMLVLFSGDGSQFSYQCDSPYVSYTITGFEMFIHIPVEGCV
jgi:hypothetical protein